MKEKQSDVLILGGGPAGTAAAMMLRKRDPNCKVSIIEKSNYDGLRVGETLQPTIRDLLSPLGIWEAFEKEAHLPSFGTQSIWGSDKMYDNEFIFQTKGSGWHINKNKFDQFLCQEAQKRGCDIHLNTTFTCRENSDGEWKFDLIRENSEKVEHRTKFVVDATGRNALFAKQMGAKKIRFDNLVGIYQYYDITGEIPNRSTLIEAWENGWWYSAVLPNNRLVAVCMTDADLVSRYQLKEKEGFDKVLKATKYTHERCSHGSKRSDIKIWAAGSQMLEYFYGKQWLAIGDASNTFDPLSSQGIFKAIKEGIFGAYAISDHKNGIPNSFSKYTSIVKRNYQSYLNTKCSYYKEEQRWKENLFWERRFQNQQIQELSLA